MKAPTMHTQNKFEWTTPVLEDITDTPAGVAYLKKIHVTIFRDEYAQSLEVKNLTLKQLRELIMSTTAWSKSALPWLKLAVFGNKATKAGSLRNDANVIEITGVELDYDVKQMTFDAAIATVRRAGLRALLYTSPSYTDEQPKWRVILPTSQQLPPAERGRLLARINGVLGGVASIESFTLSQSYYYGSVNNNPAHRAELIDGDYIDLRNDLDAGALGKQGKKKDARISDETYIAEIRSGAVYHTGLLTLSSRRAAAGWSGEQIEQMLQDLLNQSEGPRDSRWQKTWDDIPGIAASAVEKYAAAARAEMFTDLGNARRLVRIYGENIRYVHLWCQWLIWQDGHWRKDEDGAIIRMAKATVEQMFAEAALINDEHRRNAMRAHALRCQSVQRLAAMVKLAESEIEVVLSVEKIDADPLMLGVTNGVIDLRTGQFREAQREDYVTKMAGTAYDADAKCPHWEAFLKKILDQPLIEYMQRVTGYVLTGLTGEEVMFIPWGDGNNGKSTYRETIFALLGDYAVGAEASLLITNKRSGGATPDLVRLFGARLVTVNETEENDHLNEARVKFMTSHDVITARNLYKEPFDFTPTHKTMLTTQHKPIIKGTDEGIWRRIQLWPFVKVIAAKERDRYFRENKLLPELPGILNWALEGLKQYQKDGLKPPQAVTEATNEYREDMDLVGHFVDECCEKGAAYQETTAALHCKYEIWAKNSVGFSMSAIALGRLLGKKGFKTKQVGRARGVRGLRLNPNPPTAPF